MPSWAEVIVVPVTFVQVTPFLLNSISADTPVIVRLPSLKAGVVGAAGAGTSGIAALDVHTSDAGAVGVAQ